MNNNDFCLVHSPHGFKIGEIVSHVVGIAWRGHVTGAEFSHKDEEWLILVKWYAGDKKGELGKHWHYNLVKIEEN